MQSLCLLCYVNSNSLYNCYYLDFHRFSSKCTNVREICRLRATQRNVLILFFAKYRMLNIVRCTRQGKRAQCMKFSDDSVFTLDIYIFQYVVFSYLNKKAHKAMLLLLFVLLYLYLLQNQ